MGLFGNEDASRRIIPKFGKEIQYIKDLIASPVVKAVSTSLREPGK